MALFTPEELEEFRRADAEIEASFQLTNEDLRRSRKLDCDAVLEGKDNKAKQVAAQRKAYYEANRDKVAAQQKAYREANRDKYNAYMREYLRKRRSVKTTTA